MLWICENWKKRIFSLVYIKRGLLFIGTQKTKVLFPFPVVYIVGSFPKFEGTGITLLQLGAQNCYNSLCMSRLGK